MLLQMDLYNPLSWYELTCGEIAYVEFFAAHNTESIHRKYGCMLCATIGLARTICLYTVHIRYYWQGNHQIYGHIRCIYTVLANPRYTQPVHLQAKNHCFSISRPSAHKCYIVILMYLSAHVLLRHTSDILERTCIVIYF